MPLPYYDRVITLYTSLVEDRGVKIPDLFKMVKDTGNPYDISKAWMYAVYNKEITDPGAKRFNALYLVLQKKKNQLISAGHLFNNQIARYQCPQTAGQKKNVLISFRFPDIDAVVYQRPGLNND